MKRLVGAACATLMLFVGGCGTTNSRSLIPTASSEFSASRDRIIARRDTSRLYGDLFVLLQNYYTSSDLLLREEGWTVSDSELPKPPKSVVLYDDTDSHKRAIARYRAAGFDASRGLCDYTIHVLGETHSGYKFTRRSFDILAGAGASLLGIFKAAAETVSTYALGTALLQAWSQNFEEYAFLTASVGTIGRKVLTAQDKYRQGVESDATPQPKNWAEATIQIQRYNSFCLATGMRSLVEDAVGKADVYFDEETLTVEFIDTRSLDEIKRVADIREREQAGRLITRAQNRVDRLRQEIEQIARKLAEADAILARYARNPYFDASTNTVRLTEAKNNAAAARGAYNGAVSAGADRATLEAAEVAASNAEREAAEASALSDALSTKGRYGTDWRSVRETAIAEALKESAEARASLKGDVAPPPAPAED